MPELIYSGRLTSGIGSLDWGITGLTLLPTETGALLLATTGPRGGVTAYSLGSGPVTLTDHAYFDIAWSSDALPEHAFSTYPARRISPWPRGENPGSGPSHRTPPANWAARRSCRRSRPTPGPRWTCRRARRTASTSVTG
jgi:hypothetical protein